MSMSEKSEIKILLVVIWRSLVQPEPQQTPLRTGTDKVPSSAAAGKLDPS